MLLQTLSVPRWSSTRPVWDFLGFRNNPATTVYHKGTIVANKAYTMGRP
jgi:hypothetical protein